MTHFHLIYERSNWTLKRDSNDQPVATYANLPKGDAILKAVQHVQDMEATLTIHKTDGGVAEQRHFPASEPESRPGEAIPMPEMAALDASSSRD